MVQASNQFLAHYILIHNLQIFYWQVGSILGATGNGRDWEMQCKWKAHGTTSWNLLETPGMAQVLWAYFQCGEMLCDSNLKNGTYETPGWRDRAYSLCKKNKPFYELFIREWELEVSRTNPSWGEEHTSFQARRASRMHLASQRGSDNILSLSASTQRLKEENFLLLLMNAFIIF